MAERVDVPAGHTHTKYVFKGLNFKAMGTLLIQFTSVGPAGPRILYDAADTDSTLAFKCIPKGKSCTP